MSHVGEKKVEKNVGISRYIFRFHTRSFREDNNAVGEILTMALSLIKKYKVEQNWRLELTPSVDAPWARKMPALLDGKYLFCNHHVLLCHPLQATSSFHEISFTMSQILNELVNWINDKYFYNFVLKCLNYH